MKITGRTCGWIIPGKEKRVLKLLRNHQLECDQDFVARCPRIIRRKSTRSLHVEFAREELSAFGVLIRTGVTS